MDMHWWMPRHLVSIDDPQANHLTGYGNGRFYLALSNESEDARSVTVTLNRERIPHAIDRSYPARLWTDGKPAGATAVVNGKVRLQLSAKGLTAIAVDALPVFTESERDQHSDRRKHHRADADKTIGIRRQRG
ncbi:MAG: hypothetical protein ACREXP_26530 [Steroidobacteraceae bacterium]